MMGRAVSSLHGEEHMNGELLRNIRTRVLENAHEVREDNYDRAVQELNVIREMNELEAFDGPLHSINLADYAFAPGLQERWRDSCANEIWDQHGNLVGLVSDEFNRHFYHWLDQHDGMRFEAIKYPGNNMTWLVSRNVELMLKLTFGGK
jgi:hypothetical protein